MRQGTISRNKATEYGPVAKTFHWLTVVLLIVQFTLGWLMPNIERGMQPESMMSLHMSFGLVILVLVVLRFAWWLGHGAPPPEARLPHWQRVLSQLIHLALYLLVFAMTLSGWFFASMRGWRIILFGTISVSGLVTQGSATGHTIGELHAARDDWRACRGGACTLARFPRSGDAAHATTLQRFRLMGISRCRTRIRLRPQRVPGWPAWHLAAPAEGVATGNGA